MAATLPETVTISTETLIDVAAELLAWGSVFVALNGGQEAGLSLNIESLAQRLLARVAPSPWDEKGFSCVDPLVVEVHARSHELGCLGLFPTDAGRNTAAAARVRETGVAYGDGLTDEEVARERAAYTNEKGGAA